jgi:hypothetical protein
VYDIKERSQAESVFGIRALRKVFGPKRYLGGGEDCQSEELHDLNSLNMIRAIKRN